MEGLTFEFLLKVVFFHRSEVEKIDLHLPRSFYRTISPEEQGITWWSPLIICDETSGQPGGASFSSPASPGCLRTEPVGAGKPDVRIVPADSDR